MQFLGAASTFASTLRLKSKFFFKNNFSLNPMYKHNFQFLWYTVLYTLMPNTKLTSNVRESNLSPKTIPSIYLIKWGFFSRTRHLTFRLIYFYFYCRYYIFSLLIFVCMLIYFFGLDYTLHYPSNASGGCLDTFDGPENPLDIAF